MTDLGATPTRRRSDVERLFERSGDAPPDSLVSLTRQTADRVFGIDPDAVGPVRKGDRLGPYEVVALLGAGGQAFVYEARHRQLDRRVALKVPRKGVASKILHEARLAARLDHDHIVRIEDVSEQGDVPYLVMERCGGGSLQTLMERHPDGLPLERVRAIAGAVLDALAFAHARGVVHRDVKPANILFDEAGEVKLADLGIGTLATTGKELEHSVTLSRTVTGVAGTPLFMAPEQERPQMLGGAKLDGRADIFAFGKVLFLMLTGAYPRTVRPPSRLVEGLDPAWDDVVFRCLEDDREDRFPDAAAVTAAIEAIAPSADEAPAFRVAPPPRRAPAAPPASQRPARPRRPVGARLSVSRAISEGASLYHSGSFGVIFLAAFLCDLLTGVSLLLLGGLLYGGVYRMCLKAQAGHRPRLGDLFGAGRLFLPLTFMFLITTIFELAGLILLVVPGLLFGAITFYTLILIADRGDRFGEAWGESSRAVMRGGFGAHLALVIYFVVLSVPSLIAAALAGPLGSLVTAFFAPLTFGVFTSAYRQVVLGIDSPAAEIAYARVHGREAA